ncbi:hypothetical protein SBRCBS47491_006702 [Sporothrix bragantina]|uniref:Peptidase family m20 m25 m40 protein n=1 Tax=Sporothrix bragantina TaxID=671064 RepID=A0ABP0C748_9PEZI
MAEATTDAVAVASDAASSNASTITPFEALQKQTSHPRRMRPPDMMANATASDEARVPLRQTSQLSPEEPRANPEKLSHRESRVGLRGLFSRNKASSGQDARASIVDFSNWPHFYTPWADAAHAKNALAQPSLSPVPQEQPLPPAQPAAVTTSTLQAQQTPLAPPPTEPAILGIPSTTKVKKPTAPLRSRTPGPSTRPARGSLATWDPPPLFQAYPQAVKHAQLPICTTAIDVLMRLQAATNGAGADIGDAPEDRSATAEKTAEKPKRRHRRNASGSSMKLEWVSKIYVLVTSGYLLQYSAEGSFDRLPEKILPISRDSAAFASDLIPGRHWVLRVCSSMDADGLQTTDSRSIFSRFPFRGNERRHASTFLMVFEGAEEMESWITILRREIEQLGGKKHLSETGKPKAEQVAVDPRFQVSQRTLVVRDPERFSRILNSGDVASMLRNAPPQNNSQTSQAAHLHPNQHLEAPNALGEREPMSDDMSTTNSVYSHDGRQLENLRDSAGNRFSYISTGQRTVVTSDSSSPPCSPVRDSFTGNNTSDELQPTTAVTTATTSSPAVTATPSPPLPESPEARPRPNAAAILERRQSMQVMASSQRMANMHLLPTQLPPQQPPPTEALPRLPISSFSITSPMTKPLPPPVPLRRETNFSLFDSVPTIPNFSVPHLASKRYSAVMTPSPPMPASPALAPGPMQEPQTHSYSIFPQPPRETPRTQQPLIPPAVRNSRRRLPPPSLAFSRPLSIVADHASPNATSPAKNSVADASNPSVDDNGLNSPGYGSDVPDTPALFNSWKSPSNPSSSATEPPSSSHSSHSSLRRRSGSFSSLPRGRKSSNASTSSSKNTVSEAPARASPRRHSSMLTLRSSGDASTPIETRTIVVSQRTSMMLPMSKYNALSPRLPEDERDAWGFRPPSSHSRPQSRGNSMPRQSTTPPTSSGSNRSFMGRRPNEYKRASMFVQPSTASFGNNAYTTSNANSFTGPNSLPLPRPMSLYHTADMSRIGGSVDTGRGRNAIKPEPLGPGPGTGTGPLTPLPAHTNNVPGTHGRARSSSASKATLSRRGMTQLVDGPPPAPPPTCALPPPPAPPPTCALPPPPAPPPTCALPPLPVKTSELDSRRLTLQI